MLLLFWFKWAAMFDLYSRSKTDVLLEFKLVLLLFRCVLELFEFKNVSSLLDASSFEEAPDEADVDDNDDFLSMSWSLDDEPAFLYALAAALLLAKFFIELVRLLNLSKTSSARVMLFVSVFVDLNDDEELVELPNTFEVSVIVCDFRLLFPFSFLAGWLVLALFEVNMDVV